MNQTALLPNLAYLKPKHPALQDAVPAAGRASDISFSIEEKKTAGYFQPPYIRMTCVICAYAVLNRSSLVYGTEQLHFLLNGSLDSFKAGSQQLTRVITLTLLIFACFDVLSCSFCEGKLALGVYIDLSNAQRDCFLDHVSRDACAAVKNQRKVACQLLDCIPVSYTHLPSHFPS